jgi:hypothetical protein
MRGADEEVPWARRVHGKRKKPKKKKIVSRS